MKTKIEITINGSKETYFVDENQVYNNNWNEKIQEFYDLAK